MDFKFLIILILIVDLLLKVLRYLIGNFIKVNTIFLRIDYLYILGDKEGIKNELNPLSWYRFYVNYSETRYVGVYRLMRWM